MQGVLKGARSVLERQEAEPPLSFFYSSNFDTRKNSNPISIYHHSFFYIKDFFYTGSYIIIDI